MVGIDLFVLYVTILHRCCIMLSELHKVKKWCGEPIWRTGRLRDRQEITTNTLPG
jgi:hypothetical protein